MESFSLVTLLCQQKPYHATSHINLGTLKQDKNLTYCEKTYGCSYT